MKARSPAVTVNPCPHRPRTAPWAETVASTRPGSWQVRRGSLPPRWAASRRPRRTTCPATCGPVSLLCRTPTHDGPHPDRRPRHPPRPVLQQRATPWACPSLRKPLGPLRSQPFSKATAPTFLPSIYGEVLTWGSHDVTVLKFSVLEGPRWRCLSNGPSAAAWRSSPPDRGERAPCAVHSCRSRVPPPILPRAIRTPPPTTTRSR